MFRSARADDVIIVGSGLAIKRNIINLAIVMVLPVVLFFSWLALIVLQEPGSHN